MQENNWLVTLWPSQSFRNLKILPLRTTSCPLLLPVLRTGSLLFLAFCLLTSSSFAAPAGDSSEETIFLRACGVPETTRSDIASQATREIVRAFRARYPRIQVASPTGLAIPGGKSSDVTPLMQIAGDVAPDVLNVNFRTSDTYIQQRFLYPLDKYVEKAAGASIKNGHLLKLDDYLHALENCQHYDRELKDRVPRRCWEVIRRECPYGENCPYVRSWNETPAKQHEHIWCFPLGQVVTALFYRKDLFLEAGLPDRVPQTMEELLDWSRQLTNPKANRFGLLLDMRDLAWSSASFLYSSGGLMVDRNAKGEWQCVFDSDAAVDAYYFVARLFHEPFENQYGRFHGVVYTGETSGVGTVECAMQFGYLSQAFFHARDPAQYGFGPVPEGSNGIRGSEFNANMAGIYAGLENEPAKRDAAWTFMHFYNGTEARDIRTRTFVENGLARFVPASLLNSAGYSDLARQVPKGWDDAAALALENGVPEPYGRNCQYVYAYVSKAIDQIRTDSAVRDAVERRDAESARNRIREILRYRVERTNEKMLNLLTPQQRQFRGWVAVAVAAFVAIAFTFVFWKLFRVFAQTQTSSFEGSRGGYFQCLRYKWAYLMLLPAIGSVLLWGYYPLVRGTFMAFQDYNIRGFSQWVGVENFANVLFDDEFWFAMWVTVKYAILYILFAFWTPIALALLLVEVPRGKILFRTIYYLPAVLSGIITIFLWKEFYGSNGMLNQVLNSCLHLAHKVTGIEFEPINTVWLQSPQFALFFCLLPQIWAGLGPGCLIYLAALKTVPEEMYEAADLDGAGILSKIFHVALPNIRSLVAINFIGVIIGVIHGGGGMVLAMTGGGPYTPYGETEVIGLHIFWQAFAYLKFGSATAMAWILGSLLIGFTVQQLQRMSRMEFRRAG